MARIHTHVDTRRESERSLFSVRTLPPPRAGAPGPGRGHGADGQRGWANALSASLKLLEHRSLPLPHEQAVSRAEEDLRMSRT